MPENREEPRNLIFLHVPKAAGSTLRAVVARQYKDDHIYRITTDPSVKASIAAFRDLPRSKRKKIRCVMGHGPFGLHRDLIGFTEYVTLLRDPVSRIISLYYYARRSGHRHHEVITEKDMSLHDYVTSGMNEEIQNGMTRQIAGLVDEVPDRDALEQAKNHLSDHFGVVGLVEHFDESLLLMKRQYGWGQVAYRRRRVGKGRPRKEDISEETLHEILERNRLDQELYHFVRKRFKNSLSGIDLEEELRWHQLKCRGYSIIGYWLDGARKAVRMFVPKQILRAG
jgi:hypothetical protein